VTHKEELRLLSPGVGVAVMASMMAGATSFPSVAFARRSSRRTCEIRSELLPRPEIYDKLLFRPEICGAAASLSS
jgi:hypothetical protein